MESVDVDYVEKNWKDCIFYEEPFLLKPPF